jgi:hypothetical protein
MSGELEVVVGGSEYRALSPSSSSADHTDKRAPSGLMLLVCMIDVRERLSAER